MTLQYIIVGIVLAMCVGLAVRYFHREWKQNVRCKDYGCAGCPFYDKCRKTIKR